MEALYEMHRVHGLIPKSVLKQQLRFIVNTQETLLWVLTILTDSVTFYLDMCWVDTIKIKQNIYFTLLRFNLTEARFR